MDIAVYYDQGLKETGMEFLQKSDAEIRAVIDESGVEVLGYEKVGDWLNKRGKGAVLVFLQDVMPYTAFDADMDNLFTTVNRLGGFLKRGGVVVWIGDVPFFYRVRCVPSDVDVGEVKARAERFLTSTFLREKLKPVSRDGQICYRDIIGNNYIPAYIAGEEVLAPYPRPIPLPTRYLGVVDISSVCYLDAPVRAEETPFAKMIKKEFPDVDFGRSLRPHKSTRVTAINLVQLNTPFCRGDYSGMWIAKVGEGYFIRLFDYGNLSKKEIRFAIEFGRYFAQLQLSATA